MLSANDIALVRASFARVVLIQNAAADLSTTACLRSRRNCVSFFQTICVNKSTSSCR